MDATKALDILQRGIALLDDALPGAGIPLPFPIAVAAKLAEAVNSIKKNVDERVAEGKLVASSKDQAFIRSLAEKLSAKNDILAERIANS